MPVAHRPAASARRHESLACVFAPDNCDPIGLHPQQQGFADAVFQAVGSGR
jgi:hypothetical protein